MSEEEKKKNLLALPETTGRQRFQLFWDESLCCVAACLRPSPATRGVNSIKEDKEAQRLVYGDLMAAYNDNLITNSLILALSLLSA